MLDMKSNIQLSSSIMVSPYLYEKNAITAMQRMFIDAIDITVRNRSNFTFRTSLLYPSTIVFAPYKNTVFMFGFYKTYGLSLNNETASCLSAGWIQQKNHEVKTMAGVGKTGMKIIEAIVVLIIAAALFPLLKSSLEDLFNLSGLGAAVSAGIITVTGLLIAFGVLMKVWSQ
jgi:hypothetical protein